MIGWAKDMGRNEDGEKPEVLMEVGEVINRLGECSVVTKQLEQIENGVWVHGRMGLDIAFLKRDETEAAYVGIQLCGEENVVGLVIENGETGDGKEFGDEQLRYMVEQQGAKVLRMPIAEFRNWVEFYEQIEEKGYLEKLGSKVLEYSGLERLTNGEFGVLIDDFGKVTRENWDYLYMNGVYELGDAENLDVGFIGNDGVAIVPMGYVREGRLEGQVLVEEVMERVLVPGVIIPRPGENKREAYERAFQATTYYRSHFGRDDVLVPLYRDGQASLWKKLGCEVVEPGGEKDRVSVGEVIRYGYLGKSNVDPGWFALRGLSLPGRGEWLNFRGIDVIFNKKNSFGGREIMAVDDVMVLKKSKNLRSGRETGVMSNVIGIKIFEDSKSVEEMMEEGDFLVRDLVHYSGTAGGHVAYLNRHLFEEWKKNGGPFSTDEADDWTGGLEQRIAYGYGLPTNAPEVWYTHARLKPGIGGGNRAFALRDASNNTEWVVIDAGLDFTATPAGWQGIGKQEGTADGMMRNFRMGVAPMFNGWWAREYLFQTAKNFPALCDSSYVAKDMVAQYLISELFSRATEEEIMAKLPEAIAGAVMNEGPLYSNIWRRGGDFALGAIDKDHSHEDHDHNIPFMAEEARVVMSGACMAMTGAKTRRATSWRGKHDRVTLLTEEKVGAAYQYKERKIEPYWMSGKAVRLTREVTMTPRFVSHSSPSVNRTYEIGANGGKITIFDSGDWRNDIDGRSMRAIEGAAKQNPDVIMMETTNFGGEKLMGNEDMVRDTMLRLVNEAGNGAVVVVVASNAPERLLKILEVAEKSGRKLALSYAHAETARGLKIGKELAPPGAEGFEHVLPYEIGGREVTLWAKTMTRPRAHQRDMLAVVSGMSDGLGVLDATRLSSEGEKWIVVVSPFEQWDQFDRISYPHGLHVMWSAPYLYSWDAKWFTGANYNWLKRVGGKMYANMEVLGLGGRVTQTFDQKMMLHVSGHAGREETIAALDLLIKGTGGRGKNDVLIIPMHGDNPDFVTKELVRRLGVPLDRIVTKMDRYYPGRPLKMGNDPGYWIKLK